MEFRLPDIGEGITEGEIIKWMVKEGDQVKEDQPLVEVMTDKVNVQIPSPRTGKVSKILVKEGDVAKVGETIMVIDDGTGGSSPTTSSPTALAASRPASATAIQQTQVQPPGAAVLATPATRRLARELGVDIGAVRGSGPQGRITDEDVRRATSGPGAAQSVMTVQRPQAAGGSGKEELIPLRGIRKTIAERMVKSQETAAQVTHIDEADMSELVALREASKASAEKRGVHLTYLPFIIKALIPALKEFPYLNSSLDEHNGNIILKKYYNLGIATDTEQGLVVTVLKDVDRKDIFELAGEIENLADRARKGTLTLDEVRGSTFTITNVGAIGGLFATPIINLPEAAILGLHKIAKRPVVRDGKLEVRDTTYLSLTFDHRILDGAYAARFTTRVIENIQGIKKLLAEEL
jgi:pyruvate dehydrogenase E2 component (dihydrolipoamide acetyltransferase)